MFSRMHNITKTSPTSPMMEKADVTNATTTHLGSTMLSSTFKSHTMTDKKDFSMTRNFKDTTLRGIVSGVGLLTTI
jgi:hypothetical protein